MDAGCGRDVDTVIVDGKILVQGGRTARIDEDEVYAKARQATQTLLEPRAHVALGRRRCRPHHSARVSPTPEALSSPSRI